MNYSKNHIKKIRHQLVFAISEGIDRVYNYAYAELCEDAKRLLNHRFIAHHYCNTKKIYRW